MTNEELESLVKKLSLEHFGREFNHQAIFNARLQTTGGRYHLKTHHLDFNPKILDTFPQNILEGIIKHELCHYHLHLEGKGYRHRDADFQKLLKEVGGLRYTPSFERQRGKAVRWVYSCQVCGVKVYRKRRFNLAKYRCADCQGAFDLLGKKEIKIDRKK